MVVANCSDFIDFYRITHSGDTVIPPSLKHLATIQYLLLDGKFMSFWEWHDNKIY